MCLIIILLVSGVSNHANATTDFLDSVFQEAKETEKCYVVVKDDSEYENIDDLDEESIYAFQMEEDVREDIFRINFYYSNNHICDKLVEIKINIRRIKMIQESKNIIKAKEQKNYINIIKEKIKEFYEDKTKIKDYTYLFVYILIIFIILFTIANTIMTDTNFYNENLTFRWKNLLSYDDMLYSRDVYTTNPKYENTVHLSIHPLFDVLAQTVAKVENIIFSDACPNAHYYHIVLFQILINLLSVVYLYKIFREQLKLKNIWCYLLMTIYEIATVTLLGTLAVESFLISGTLLIMSYYYLSKQKLIAASILGILVTGMCITNSIAFGIMAIFLLKNKKDILKVGISCILGGIIIFLLIPYKNYIIDNLFASVNSYVERYTPSHDLITYIKMVFYYILSSPLFFINILYTAPNGLDYIKFDLSADIPIIIITILFFIFILYNVVRNIKDRKLLAVFGLFIYNMIIHVIVRFGLYEGTIYGLHFLFAEIIMFAFGFKIENKLIKRTFIAFSILFFIIQLRYNMDGLLKCLLLFKDWK